MPTITIKTTVLPGGRIDVSDPGLPVGQAVELAVTVPVATPPPPMNLLEWLDSLPPGPRSADTWEEVERQFQEERDAWDR